VDHLDLTPELLTAVVGALTGAIASYIALRRFGPDEMKARADSELSHAQEGKVEIDTASSWIETYEKMYGIISERDTDILNLKKQYNELRDEFTEYKAGAKSLLAEERKSRRLAENERDSLKESITLLEASFIEETKKRDDEIEVLRSELLSLRTLVDQLKKENVNGCE
jgi:hypothetical protein